MALLVLRQKRFMSKMMAQVKKSFFTLAARRILKEIADGKIVVERSQPSPSAKRSIAFVSTSGSFNDTYEATQRDLNAPAVVEPLIACEDVQSPLKNRDKLKQN